MFSGKRTKQNTVMTDTIIGQDSIVEGKLYSKASLRIEGQVNGDVECAGDVTLGEKAVVYSKIKARNVYISGTIHGTIISEGTLRIAATGKIYGDINVSSLNIANGGVFHGSSKMNVNKAGVEQEGHEGQVNEEATQDRLNPTAEISELKPRLHKIDNSHRTTSAK